MAIYPDRFLPVIAGRPCGAAIQKRHGLRCGPWFAASLRSSR